MKSQNLNSFLFFGGGTGMSRIIKPFISSENFSTESKIYAIVSTFDNGGSSGILRSHYGAPALGDIRKVLSALSNKSNSEFLEYRFKNEPLAGHTVGNLLLYSYLKKTNSLESAIKIYQEKYTEKTINLLPSSVLSANLIANFQSELIFGESRVEKISHEKIDDLYLLSKDKSEINADKKIIDIINKCSFIFFSPGSFYTSLLASMLPVGIVQAIKSSNAKIVLFQNRDKESFMNHINFMNYKLNGLTPDIIASSNESLRTNLEKKYPQIKFIYHDFFSDNSKLHDFDKTKMFFEDFLKSIYS